jgi:PAS domain-containing protein
VLGHRARYILRASQAFRDLAKHQTSLENAQRIAHLGSWEWDLARNEIYWSSETYRILGLEPGVLIVGFDPFIERVHPDDREQVQQAFRELLKTGNFSGEGARIVLPDGSLRHIQLQGIGTFDADGNL